MTGLWIAGMIVCFLWFALPPQPSEGADGLAVIGFLICLLGLQVELAVDRLVASWRVQEGERKKWRAPPPRKTQVPSQFR